MICPIARPERKITEIKREKNALSLASEAGIYRIEPQTPEIVRVRYTQRERFAESKRTNVLVREGLSDWEYKDAEQEVELTMEGLVLRINKETASIRYFDRHGKLLLCERPSESKELEEFDAYKAVHDEKTEVEKFETPDGIKQVIRDARKVFDKKLYKTRLHLVFGDEEAIYGFGQNDEGLLNLRGKKLYIHHANMKIAIPLMVSSRGYGILVDTYSPLIFSDTGEGAYIRTEADSEMDFYFINGGSMDGVVKGYRSLTGKAVMLPKWAFGYLQSQERYETQEEILSVAEGFRKRGFGVDCLVLDWCSWEDGMWGQKTVDRTRFPELKAMTDALHEMHMRFMISIWPNMSPQTDNFREMKESGLLLPGTEIYNPYREAGRKLYWEQAKKGLFDFGVDAWWCDSSEPLTPEWAHMVKPEADAAYYEYFSEGSKQLATEDMHSFGYYHAMTMYEGQRSTDSKKRVMNLTRCAYTGQQKFGTVLWSGDVAASWDTLRKQIAGGLSFCASGLPYWTTDIGAFFVKKGLPWYWNGEYEEGNQNPGYRELYTRWFQFGAFLPVFRSHGTDTRREPWMFGDEGELFYDALKKANAMRYQFLPYLYSCAYRVWKEDFTVMRMLAFDFPDDPKARECADQFLFGDRVMVCPVLQPMYFDCTGKPVEAAKQRKVYLPAQKGGWYDFYSGKHYEGGQEILAEAPIDIIPVYIKAGTILPLANPAGSTEEVDMETLTIQVYSGLDAEFVLYEDAGDGYGYEKGEYQLTEMIWNEAKRELRMRSATGSARKLFTGKILGLKNEENGPINANVIWEQNSELEKRVMENGK